MTIKTDGGDLISYIDAIMLEILQCIRNKIAYEY